MTCPKCNAETLSDSAQYCTKCGTSLLRRPRAELVPSLQADRIQPGCLSHAASPIFNNSEADAGNPAEKVIETQWTKIEKVPLARALFARISEHLPKPPIRSPSKESAVDGELHGSEPRQDPHPAGGRILFVNRAQVVTRDCAACGGGLASTPAGERLLLADVTETVCYLFCANCGDQILSHVQSGEAGKHYVWDWAIPLRKEVTDKDFL